MNQEPQAGDTEQMTSAAHVRFANQFKETAGGSSFGCNDIAIGSSDSRSLMVHSNTTSR